MKEIEEMKKKYKFIHFESVAIVGSDISWKCLNNKNKEVLAVIMYYKPWKQYVTQFNDGCVFNNQCLLDIADFLSQLNKE